MKIFILSVLRFYKRWLSPLLPQACRYEPTCSIYAQEAVGEHGVLRGGILAARRLCRCHPWGGHGWDPVPSASTVDQAIRPLPGLGLPSGQADSRADRLAD